jgi:hypothetical protein
MKRSYLIPAFLLMTMGLSSCAIVEGIFKAGVWVGVLAVVAVIVLIIFLITRVSNKK